MSVQLDNPQAERGEPLLVWIDNRVEGCGARPT